MHTLPVLFRRGAVVPFTGGRVAVDGIGVEVDRVHDAGLGERREQCVAIGEGSAGRSL